MLYNGYYIIIIISQKPCLNNCFIVHCFEQNNNKRTLFDIALGNHALRAQATPVIQFSSSR